MRNFFFLTLSRSWILKSVLKISECYFPSKPGWLPNPCCKHLCRHISISSKMHSGNVWFVLQICWAVLCGGEKAMSRMIDSWSRNPPVTTTFDIWSSAIRWTILWRICIAEQRTFNKRDCIVAFCFNASTPYGWSRSRLRIFVITVYRSS